MRGYGLAAAVTALSAAALAQNSSDELIQLIRRNDLTGLKVRLSAGADVNTRDARGNTLLMEAAGFGSAASVRLLLGSGADVNAKNQFDATALFLGAANQEKARMLLQKGAEVNAKTKTGRTPLMIAASCDGCSAIVKMLLDSGADAKAVDSHKIGALQLAADVDDLDSIKLLLAAGANAKTEDQARITPLASTAQNCNLEGTKLLLARGADPNIGNTAAGEVKFGKIQLISITPLMLAATYCAPEVVKALVDAGAKVNATDIRGMPPLVYAVSSEEQNAAVARMLINAGADVNAKTNAGETALDWAKKFGNARMISLLTTAGAKEGVPYTSPERKGAGGLPLLQAVEKGTGILQNGATEFFNQSACVGCHHQPSALMAVSAARRAGVKVSEPEAKAYIKMMEGQSMAFQQLMVERGDTGGLFDGWNMILNALGSERYEPSPLTDVLVTYIASFQRHDGSCNQGGIARAPAEEGRMQRVALSVRSMQLYGTPGLKEDFDKRIAGARNYMLNARARTTDEAAMQIAGLHWIGGSDEKIRAFAKALIAAQRTDGGWGQNPNLTSDAYATGEALWALHESGTLKPNDPVYQKGVKYLLSTQWEDGSWYVRSRSPKFQPYFQSGFPHDHDQWISSAATSWAVRALAPAVER
jgi:ankyrin repeat protein